MFKNKVPLLDRLTQSFVVLEKATKPNHGLKSNEIKLAQQLLEKNIDFAFNEVMACKMYHALRNSFLLDVFKETKYTSDGESLRLALLGNGKPTKSEMKYRDNLKAALNNLSFKSTDILRFYRQAEMQLHKYTEILAETSDSDITEVFHYDTKVNFRLKLMEDRAIALPEDSIMVELAPLTLIKRARDAGVVAPELLPFDLLVREILNQR